MPLGIVSDEDFSKEKSSLEKPRPNTGVFIPPVPHAEVIDLPSKGRGSTPEVPNTLRNIIGETSVLDGRQEAIELADKWGIKPSSVSAYANGATSTSTYDKKPNKPQLDKARRRIIKSARQKLHAALDNITDEKLEKTKAVELAQIAKNMSGIIKEMEPDNPDAGDSSKGPVFMIYAPQFKKEETFDMIRVNE